MRQPIPRLLLLLAVAAQPLACGYPRAPVPPQLELPKPVSDLHAARKGNKVYLSWTVPLLTTDQQIVRHMGPTRICRSTEGTMKQCGTPVGEALPLMFAKGMLQKKNLPRIAANYEDNLSPSAFNSAGAFTYAVEVLNESLRSAGLSNQVAVLAAPTLPPPTDFTAKVTVNGVALSWTEASPVHNTDELRHAYRIYRRLEGSDKETLVANVNLGETSFLDRAAEWEKTYYYRATTVSLVSLPGVHPCQDNPAGSTAGCAETADVEGDDTPAVKVFVDDVFPPAVPSGLQAVFSGAGQQPFIDLVWAPDSEADLAGYNIYRREGAAEPAKLNGDPVKTPAYRDNSVQSGKTYFYSVSAVDARGNQSARSEEANETVP